jgi:hypothetical protein
MTPLYCARLYVRYGDDEGDELIVFVHSHDIVTATATVRREFDPGEYTLVSIEHLHRAAFRIADDAREGLRK